MNKSIILVTMSLFCVGLLRAQIVFEPAYFITNAGDSVTCFIKDTDPQHTPSTFKYRLTANGEVLSGNLEEVLEFAIYNGPVYKRFDVQLDRSSYDVSKVDNKKAKPDLARPLFLQQLIKGDANLYTYANQTFKTYFYSLDDSTVTQLIFRKWMEQLTVKYNYQFRQQLATILQGRQLQLNDFKRVRYNQKELIHLFSRFNGNTQSTDLQNNSRKHFELAILAGYQLSSLEIKRSGEVISFGYSGSYRIACELEYYLPINNNKWSAYFAPAYTSYKAKTPIKYNQMAAADYHSFDLPIGLRHSFYLNDEQRLFLSLAYEFCLAVDSKVQYGHDQEYALKGLPAYKFELGYSNKRLSVQLNYGLDRELMNAYVYWQSSYNYLHLGLAYTLWAK